MEVEAYNWITNWGPLVNPFINYIFSPISRLVIFVYHLTEPFRDIIYYEHILPIYLFHFQHLVEPLFFMAQHFSVRFLESLPGIDFEKLFPIIIFVFGCGGMVSVYCYMEIINMCLKLSKHEVCKRIENKSEMKNICSTVSSESGRNQQLDDKHSNGSNANALDNKNLENILHENQLKSRTRNNQQLNQIKQSKNTDQGPCEIVLSNAVKEPFPENDATKQTVKHTKKGTKLMQSKSKTRICWTCHLLGSSLLKCSGCKRARYCGETCYREDWERHKEWCWRKREQRENKKRTGWSIARQMEVGEKDEVD
eukprot:GFUD01004542.1.p1 GENE.GFUD01004542.1~~GFUD01004542.1.p1  ORF type:complete len:360 (-),score=88.50 GFUD01004542.1:151-1080(-)